jgi:hypothetical protein
MFFSITFYQRLCFRLPHYQLTYSQTTPGILFASLSLTIKHMSAEADLTLPKHSRPHHNGHVTTAHAHYLPAHVRTSESPVYRGGLVDVPESCSIDCAVFAGTPRTHLRSPGLPRIWQSFFSTHHHFTIAACLDTNSSLTKRHNKPRQQPT